MRKTILASLLVLGACAQVQQPASDAVACATALLAVNSSNPVVLASTAASTPACVGLASDVIQAIVSRVSAQQRARGVRG